MSSMFLGDYLHWLDEQPEASFEAIITDPPYGLKRYIFTMPVNERTVGFARYELKAPRHQMVWQVV